MNNRLQDVIMARATPPGIGAIGVIRLSGPGSIGVVDDVFKGPSLAKAEGYTIHYGRITGENGVIDDVLVSVFRAPKSYTGEDSIEISCHGSEYILSEVMQLLAQKGARMAEPGEFTLRAFLNGKMDLSQAEAVADLIASDSEASHKLAMDQMRGGFRKRIEHLRGELIHFASLVELELDFGEEDVEFADRSQLRDLVTKLHTIVNELASSFRYGNVMKNGIYTVIAGRPNAGKSTLLNALLGEERAIVSDVEGTTRDTIEDVLILEGLKFRLVDTAGIRAASDEIEKLGIERTMESIGRSSLVLYIFDGSKLHADAVREDIQRIGLTELPHLLIANKSDLGLQPDIKDLADLTLSAKEPNDVHKLAESMVQKVLNDLPMMADVVVGNMRHLEALRNSSDAMNNVLNGLHTGLSGDLIAFDIREALHHLGLITGAVTTDDLLDNIFRHFCIGK